MPTTKRMIADTGYEVTHAIRLGDREIMLAENMNEPEGLFYMKAEHRENGILSEYGNIQYSSSYLAIMEEFVGSVTRQIDTLQKTISNYAPMPITADKCYPHDYSQDITGKVMVVKASALRPEYRRADCQLVYVTGGFGAHANSRGSAVYCCYLSDGQQTRFERQEIQGEIKELPEWAKERLAVIQEERAAKTQNQREVVAGYVITNRIEVGNTLFVLGENPKASSPYVTWQRKEGRTGYDHGHYMNDREAALADLHKRADRERESLSSGRGTKKRDDAR